MVDSSTPQCALCFVSSSRVFGGTVTIPRAASTSSSSSVAPLVLWICNVCKNHDDALADLPQVGVLLDEYQPNGAFLLQFAAKVASVFRRALTYGHVELVAEIIAIITSNRYCSISASLRRCFVVLLEHHQTQFGLSSEIAASAVALHEMDQDKQANQPTLHAATIFANRTKQTGAFTLFVRQKLGASRNCFFRDRWSQLRLSQTDPRERRMLSVVMEEEEQIGFSKIFIYLPDIVTRMVDVAERAIRDDDDSQSTGVLSSLSPLVASLATEFDESDWDAQEYERREQEQTPHWLPNGPQSPSFASRLVRHRSRHDELPSESDTGPHSGSLGGHRVGCSCRHGFGKRNLRSERSSHSRLEMEMLLLRHRRWHHRSCHSRIARHCRRGRMAFTAHGPDGASAVGSCQVCRISQKPCGGVSSKCCLSSSAGYRTARASLRDKLFGDRRDDESSMAIFRAKKNVQLQHRSRSRDNWHEAKEGVFDYSDLREIDFTIHQDSKRTSRSSGRGSISWAAAGSSSQKVGVHASSGGFPHGSNVMMSNDQRHFSMSDIDDTDNDGEAKEEEMDGMKMEQEEYEISEQHQDEVEEVEYDDEYVYEPADSDDEVDSLGTTRYDDFEDSSDDAIGQMVRATRKIHKRKSNNEQLQMLLNGDDDDDDDGMIDFQQQMLEDELGIASGAKSPLVHQHQFVGVNLFVDYHANYTYETEEALTCAVFGIVSELLPRLMGEHDGSLIYDALQSPDLYFSPDTCKKTLMACAQNHNAPVMDLLLEQPNFLEQFDDNVVVCECARHGLVNAVNRIVTRNEDYVKNGATALQAAAEKGQVVVGQLLLRIADPTLADHRSALKAAAMQGHARFVDMLLSHGKLQAKDSMVSYILGVAAQHKQQDCVVVLCEFIKFNLIFFKETKEDTKAALKKISDPLLRSACFCLRAKIPGDVVREAMGFCEW